MSVKIIYTIIPILMLVSNSLSMDMKIPEMQQVSYESVKTSDQEQEGSPFIMGKKQTDQNPILKIPSFVESEAHFQLPEYLRPVDGQQDPVMKIPDGDNGFPQLPDAQFKAAQYQSSNLQEMPPMMNVPSGINGLPQPMDTSYQIPQYHSSKADEEAQEVPQPQDKIVPYGNDALTPPVEDQFSIPPSHEMQHDQPPVMNIPYGNDLLFPPAGDGDLDAADVPQGFQQIFGSQSSEDFQSSSDYESSESLSYSYYSILNKLVLGMGEYSASDSWDGSELSLFSWGNPSESFEGNSEWDEDSFAGKINLGRKLLSLRGLHKEKKAGDFKNFKRVLERFFKNKKVKRDVGLEGIEARGNNEVGLFSSGLGPTGDSSFFSSYEDSLEYSSYEDSLQYSSDDDYENRVLGYENKIMENVISWAAGLVDDPETASSMGNGIESAWPLWVGSNQEYDYGSGSLVSSDSASSSGALFSSPSEGTGGGLLWYSMEALASGQGPDYSSSTDSFGSSSDELRQIFRVGEAVPDARTSSFASFPSSSSLPASYFAGGSSSIPSESSGSSAMSDYSYSSDSVDIFGSKLVKVFDVDMDVSDESKGTPSSAEESGFSSSLDSVAVFGNRFASYDSSKDYSVDSFGNPIEETVNDARSGSFASFPSSDSLSASYFVEGSSSIPSESSGSSVMSEYSYSSDSVDIFGNKFVKVFDVDMDVSDEGKETPSSAEESGFPSSLDSVDVFGNRPVSYDSSKDYSVDSFGNPIVEIVKDAPDKRPDWYIFQESLSYDSSKDYSIDSFGNPILDSDMFAESLSYDSSKDYSMDSLGNPIEDSYVFEEPWSYDSSKDYSMDSFGNPVVEFVKDDSNKKATPDMFLGLSDEVTSDSQPAPSMFAGLFSPYTSEGGLGSGRDQDNELNLFSMLFSSFVSDNSYYSYESVDSYDDVQASSLDQGRQSIFGFQLSDLIDDLFPDISGGAVSGGEFDKVRQGSDENALFVFTDVNALGSDSDVGDDKLIFKQDNIQHVNCLSSQVEHVEDGKEDLEDRPFNPDNYSPPRTRLQPMGKGLKEVDVIGGKSIVVYCIPLSLLVLLVFLVWSNRYFRRTPKIVTVDPESGVSDYSIIDAKSKEIEPLLREEMTYRD